MSNDYQMIGMERVQLTDEEQVVVDARRQAHADNAPASRMKELRGQRDVLLKETDWMAMPDSPAISDAWKTYRTALRNITETTPSDDTLSNITFPTKPS